MTAQRIERTFQALAAEGRTALVAYVTVGYPTVEDSFQAALAALDANDLIYQLESSRNYNPWQKLEAISAPVMWINSADDFINPRNLAVPDQAVKRMPNAKFRMIAETEDTRGHGTHTWAKFWKDDLVQLLERTN